jgi:hypothetical protein
MSSKPRLGLGAGSGFSSASTVATTRGVSGLGMGVSLSGGASWTRQAEPGLAAIKESASQRNQDAGRTPIGGPAPVAVTAKKPSGVADELRSLAGKKSRAVPCCMINALCVLYLSVSHRSGANQVA